LTGTTDVTKTHEIPVSLIKQRYISDFNLDPARYFDGLETVTIYRCNQTGYKFYYPLTIEADSSFYELLMSNKESYYYDWKWENGIANEFIKDGDKVLDIGCGDGAFLIGLLKRKKVNAQGLELNPKALERTQKAGLTVFRETVQDYAPKHSGEYDIVTSFQVLEHIAEVKSFLSAKLDLLKPGGYMIIGVPYNNPFIYRKDKFHTLNLPPHHMGLWNKEAFESFTNIFKVEIKDIRIEKVDDLAYYTSVQLGISDLYKKMSKNSSVVRLLGKMINRFGRPPVSLLKGRNIVVVLKKL